VFEAVGELEQAANDKTVTATIEYRIVFMGSSLIRMIRDISSLHVSGLFLRNFGLRILMPLVRRAIESCHYGISNRDIVSHGISVGNDACLPSGLFSDDIGVAFVPYDLALDDR